VPVVVVAVVLDAVVLEGVVLDDADDELPHAASAMTASNMPARIPIGAFVNRPLGGTRRTMDSRWSTPPSERLAALSRRTAPSSRMIVC
jgi:hypothetical protein